MSDDSIDPEDGPAASGTGFSSAEKALGAFAAYEHPLVSGLVAGRMRDAETDPVRKRQLDMFGKAALLWWGAGIVAALIGVIVIASIASSSGTGSGGACRGGADKYDAMNISYESDDGTHWTATYPCHDGGSTTVPVPRSQVPGGGN